jgi:hypothetical protein
MLTAEQILIKRELLLDYLRRQGAISRNSGVEDMDLMQQTIELGEEDCAALCQHLSDAGWVKFLRKAGTWETGGGIATVWLTLEGFEKMRLRSMPEWMTKQAPEEVQAQANGIVKAIGDWIPKQRYKQEETYVAALAEHLEGRGIKAPEQQGASLTDVLAAYGIGIEAKVNPDRGEYDRLSGQIIRQLEEFGVVIVLIIRPDRRDLLEEYKSRFVHDRRVTFIVK